MTWTDPQDVIGSWVGDGAPTDPDLVHTWIERAEREVRRRVPDIDARLALNEADLLETVRDVVSAMVGRVFRNPDGSRQWQETVGPFSRSGTFSGETRGGLMLTASELAALGGEARRPRAFELDLLPPVV